MTKNPKKCNRPSDSSKIDFSDVKSLPSPPQVAMKILDLENDPNATVDDVAGIIQCDPAISSQILKFCNSPVAGLRHEITNIPQAVMLIGMRTAKMIGLTFSLIKNKTNESLSENFDIDRYWQNAVACGVAAKRLAALSNKDLETAFASGVLSRLGLLVLRQMDPEGVQKITLSATNDAEIQQQIKAHYGYTIYGLSALVLENWQFPEGLVKAISDSDNPSGSDDGFGDLLATSRKLADLFTESEYRDSIDSCRESFNKYFETFGSIEPQLDEVCEEITDAWKEYLEMMDIEVPEVRSLWEIENEAKQVLARLSMQLQQENMEISMQNRKLQSVSNTDQLTGLSNRRSFEEKATEEVDRAVRNARSLGLIVIDIDFFKQVNDTKGHLAGDEILKQIGKCLDKNIRKYDYLFRYGGEEFVLLVPDCRFPDVCMIAERLRESVEALEVPFENEILQVTISLGVSYMLPGEKSCWKDMFADADARLYQAKDNGRNQVCAP